jgi:hypothetical protein
MRTEFPLLKSVVGSHQASFTRPLTNQAAAFDCLDLAPASFKEGLQR